MRDARAGDQGGHAIKGRGAGQIGAGKAFGLGLGAGFGAVVPQKRFRLARQQRAGGGKAGPAQTKDRNLFACIAFNGDHGAPLSWIRLWHKRRRGKVVGVRLDHSRCYGFVTPSLHAGACRCPSPSAPSPPPTALYGRRCSTPMRPFTRPAFRPRARPPHGAGFMIPMRISGRIWRWMMRGAWGGVMINHVIGFAKARKISNVRWLTQEFNYAGRQLYDSFRPKSDFILYSVPVEG